jgi:hypothetical protein
MKSGLFMDNKINTWLYDILNSIDEDSLDQFVDQENEVRIIDLFVGTSADVGCMFVAYNLRRILNILDPDILKKFFQELAFFSCK